MEEVGDGSRRDGRRKARKRIRSPDKWAKNEKKIKRNSGAEYKASNGRTVPAKRAPSQVRCFKFYFCTYL